jgi:hypothetical protein
MVTVPKWSGPDKETAQRCPSGRLKLAPANAPEMLQAQLVSVVYANLDADAALETAALVKCQYGEASEQMVIAFDRDKAGAVVALGKVAEGHIWTVVPAKSGVTVDISDTQACCDMSKDNEFHQSRTYAWAGSAFRQTAGPTSWAGKPYVTDLVLSTSSLVFGPVVNGRRTGTVTVKVSNAGPAASGRYDVSMSLANATTSSKYLRFADEGDDCPRECHAPLGKGSSIGFTFTVSIAAADLTVTSVKLFVHAYGVQHPGSMADLNYANNSATADVRLS